MSVGRSGWSDSIRSLKVSSGVSTKRTFLGGFCSQPTRCGQGTLLRCQEACGALLNCGEHACVQVCHDGACQPCQLQVQQGEYRTAELLENNRVLVVTVLCFCFQCVTVAVATVKLCVARIKRDSMVPAIFPAENSAKGEHEG